MTRYAAMVVGAGLMVFGFSAPAKAQVHVDLGVIVPHVGARVVIGSPRVIYAPRRVYEPVYRRDDRRDRRDDRWDDRGDWYRDRRDREYYKDVREAQREYDKDLREARREYEKDLREAERDRRRR